MGEHFYIRGLGGDKLGSGDRKGVKWITSSSSAWVIELMVMPKSPRSLKFHWVCEKAYRSLAQIF